MSGRLTLPGEPISVRQARRFVAEQMLASGLGDLLATAELLTSEIVTNAIVHARTDVTVALSQHDQVVRIEVSDGLPPPLDRATVNLGGDEPDPSELIPMGGRGLRLVDEVAMRWGIESANAGKIVWFELSTAADPPL